MNAIKNIGIKTMIPARHLKVSTADLMGRQMHKTLNAELFDSALKKSLFEKSMRDGFGENSTDQNAAFYFSDAVAPLIFDGVQSSPRISVVFNDAYNVGFGATGVNVQSAKVEIDIEFNGMRHGRGPVKIELELPDRLLGLENVFKKQGEINSVASKYNGLLFNNTPAELNSNLYDVFNFVGAAFARGLELDRSQSLNLDTPSPIESISSALDETVGKTKRPEPQELSCAEFAKAVSVVMAEYPELKSKFADVFAEREKAAALVSHDLAGVEVVSSGSYFGAVEAVTASVVVQNAGRGRVVGHEVGRFGGVLPSAGQVIDLTHKDGRVSFVVEQEKESDKGR